MRAYRASVCVFLLIAGGSRVEAADWYTGEAATSSPDWIVAVDSSISVASNDSSFATIAATVPIAAAGEGGPRARIEGSVGRYGYVGGSSGRHIRGLQEEGSALVGYEWIWRDAALAGYVGLNVRNNDLSVRDPGNPVIGTEVGAKAAVEFYVKPTSKTLLAGYGSIATTHSGYYARFKAGYEIYGSAYIGPELAFLGDDFFNQWRVGGHLTGLRLGPVQAGISVGYLHDRVQKGGVYTSLDLRSGF